MSTDIRKSENHEIVAGGGEGLTSFFMPGAIDSAFRENNWSIYEMVEVLTDIALSKETKITTYKDGSVVEESVVTPKERIAAALMLDRKAKEGMVLGGLITKDRLTVRKKLDDGSEAEYNAEGMRLTMEGSSRLKTTLALLEDASKSKSDKVIDVEVLDNDKRGDAKLRERDERDDATGDERGVPPRPPRGSARSDGPVGKCSGGSPRSSGSGGDGVFSEVHGEQRTGTTVSHRQGRKDDKGTTGGAENERAGRVSKQSGRGSEGKGDGAENTERGREAGPDNPSHPATSDVGSGSESVVSVQERRPVVPGEHTTKRANRWEPGISRKGPDTDSGSIRDRETAESSLDRLKRIDRARKQAADAAASYLERRKKNQRSPSLAPGDESRPGNRDRSASDSE